MQWADPFIVAMAIVLMALPWILEPDFAKTCYPVATILPSPPQYVHRIRSLLLKGGPQLPWEAIAIILDLASGQASDTNTRAATALPATYPEYQAVRNWVNQSCSLTALDVRCRLKA